MDRDHKRAEKEYLSRSGGGAWEASKPFPPPGQLATEDHAQHFLDFAVLLKVLAPQASDRVLDLGAGTCWVTDWLRRCGVQTVAVDIALDMLRLGRSRVGGGGIAVGDMEELPFTDGAFSKACCLNAFHHVGDVHRALSEIKRILAPDGVVLFCEPGAGHSTNPTSVAAVRNYGVLEQDIVVADFMGACRDAGFADVRLHPISHIMPLFVLTQAEWRDWRAYTRSQRPFRAIQKIARALLETAGLRKHDLLFEEALAIRLARELRPMIEQHPIVTAHKVPFAAPSLKLDCAVVRVVDCPRQVAAGHQARLTLRIINTGTTAWHTPETPGEVRIGVQLLKGDGTLVDRDYSRHELTGEVSPGESYEAIVHVPAPPEAGRYHLKVDLVREGMNWFELKGSQPAVCEIEVRR
jgi:ubiquinone/menaquinone biosynthesis C-methylase UbiE